MKASEFCYWLQGYFEISGNTEVTTGQVEIIKRHLNLVFVHDIDPQQVKDTLQKIHDGKLNSEPSTSETVYRC